MSELQRGGRGSRKSSTEHWFDLFGRRLTRRDFVRVGASAAALVGLGSLPGCSGRRAAFGLDPFAFGVASGDPTPDGVVLWARLGRAAVLDAGVPGVATPVGWEIAEDEAFASIVQQGRSDAMPELGHSVHVEVAGLRPGREYFYRFHAGDAVSPVGRTKTAPPLDSMPERVNFAFASCQHYEQGYYTALRHLSREPIDAVVHLGDYIYENGAVDGRPRHHGSGEAYTLDDYRQRYALYRSDPDLQAAHHAAPWIVTTDDHEVDNDYANTHADDDQSPEALLLRRAAAYQAFYEFLPLRRSSMPAGPNMRIYRRIDFGQLIGMHVLDTRQYRDNQPCGADFSPTCAEHVDSSRGLLGSDQRAWLFDNLASSTSTWNVLAQQVLMARFRNYDDGGREVFSMDKWDGYPAERARVLEAMGRPGVRNPIVLTGDLHSNWVSRLHEDFADERSRVIATEFAGTSITSGGDGVEQHPIGARALPHNFHFDFYNSQRGYVTMAVEPDRWTSTYRRVASVQEPGGDVDTLATFVVEDGRPGVVSG
ncbi:MAG: alkaline phosphatase D family protein [Gemmatimonadota bacterium]